MKWAEHWSNEKINGLWRIIKSHGNTNANIINMRSKLTIFAACTIAIEYFARKQDTFAKLAASFSLAKLAAKIEIARLLGPI